MWHARKGRGGPCGSTHWEGHAIAASTAWWQSSTTAAPVAGGERGGAGGGGGEIGGGLGGVTGGGLAGQHEKETPEGDGQQSPCTGGHVGWAMHAASGGGKLGEMGGAAGGDGGVDGHGGGDGGGGEGGASGGGEGGDAKQPARCWQTTVRLCAYSSQEVTPTVQAKVSFVVQLSSADVGPYRRSASDAPARQSEVHVLEPP